jgi:hypothetical protein
MFTWIWVRLNQLELRRGEKIADPAFNQLSIQSIDERSRLCLFGHRVLWSVSKRNLLVEMMARPGRAHE